MLWRQRLLGTYFGQTSNWFLSHVKKTLVQCNCDPQLIITPKWSSCLLEQDCLFLCSYPRIGWKSCVSLWIPDGGASFEIQPSQNVCSNHLEAIFISLCHCLAATCLNRWILGCPCINNLQSADGVIGVFAEQWTKMAGLRPRMVFKWLSGTQSRGVRYIDIN